MKPRSLSEHALNIERAQKLIEFQARAVVVVRLCELTHPEVVELFHEAGINPPRGQLPSSTNWYLEWQPNIHSSLFWNIHEFLGKVKEVHETDQLIQAYSMYLDQTNSQELKAMLTITRAWQMLRFFDARAITATSCSKCGGKFVTEPHEVQKNFVCGLCAPPSGAGRVKSRRSA